MKIKTNIKVGRSQIVPKKRT